MRLPHVAAGIGYAGACRPESAGPRVPRCRIDLKQWNKRRAEWERLLILSLAQEEDSVEGKSLDPFQALANGELIAEAITHKLAPKRTPRAGEVRRSFTIVFVLLVIACCSVNWICCVLPAASWRKRFNGRISAVAHTER